MPQECMAWGDPGDPMADPANRTMAALALVVGMVAMAGGVDTAVAAPAGLPSESCAWEVQTRN